MIKSDDGNVEINGTGIELLADFGCIAKTLMEKYGTEAVMKTVLFCMRRHTKEGI